MVLEYPAKSSLCPCFLSQSPYQAHLLLLQPFLIKGTHCLRVPGHFSLESIMGLSVGGFRTQLRVLQGEAMLILLPGSGAQLLPLCPVTCSYHGNRMGIL